MPDQHQSHLITKFKMISKKDIEILSYMRDNARKKVTEISRQLKIPVTTIYDKIRSHNKRGIIKRNVSLLDYSKLGYNANAIISLKGSKEKQEDLKEFLEKHHNVNSLYLVNFGSEFIVEVVFKEMIKLQEFVETTEEMFQVVNRATLNIVNEIKKE